MRPGTALGLLVLLGVIVAAAAMQLLRAASL